MIGIFTKPIETVSASDVAELCEQHWPEGYTVEFKKALPHRQGRDDPWIGGADRVEEFARDKILAEIVALANGQGGTLVLGVEETKDKPARANLPAPIPRVGELARRFEDMARTCIDPPLPRLQVHSIEMEPGTGNGVIVFRLGPSRSAPHRLTGTGRSYRRHGSSTIEMTMREIQDMTLNVARGFAGIEAAFAARRSVFREWGGRCTREQAVSLAALRITAMPLESLPELGRLFGRRDLVPDDRRYQILIGERPFDLVLPQRETRERPILRGTTYIAENSYQVFRQEINQSGLVDVWLGHPPHPLDGGTEPVLQLYHGWVLGGVMDVLTTANRLRTECGAPEGEYGIEIEIARFGGAPNQPKFVYTQLGGGPMGGQHLLEPPIALPTLPVGAASTFEHALNIIDVDIFDSIGVRRTQRTRLNLVTNPSSS